MPTKPTMVKKIMAWSYSRFNDYLKCPALARYKHVDKLKEPDNAAMANGSRIHTLAEQFAGGKLAKLPTELGNFKKEFADLRKAKPSLEQDWAFDRAWAVVSWFAPNAWVRIKMDAHYIDKKNVCVVIDHKTGKIYEEDHALQRSLYAVGAFHMYPDVKTVVTKHWYLDLGEERVSTFIRTQLPALTKGWEDRTTPMLNDVRFPPTPGNHCRWCHFRKSNGGPCKF